VFVDRRIDIRTMRQDAFHFMFGAAATQPQVREILPKEAK
jgi:hypothetical protein